MKTIVICHTPLHCLLTSAIARDWSHVQVIFVADSDISRNFLDQIGLMIPAEVTVLPGAYQAGSFFSRLLIRVRNIRYLKRKKTFQNIDNLLVFNDVAVEDQLAIDQARKFGAKISLGEDGVAIYEVGGSFPSSVLARWLAKLFYGNWWLPKYKIGTDCAIDNVYASFPSLLARHIDKTKNIYSLPPFDRADYTCLAQHFGVNTSGGVNRVLVILPILTEYVALFVKKVHDALVSDKYEILIKFHPREEKSSISDFERLLGGAVSSVPKQIPCELLCMTNNVPDLVLGFRSSALHLIKALVPEINVRYWEPTKELGCQKWIDFYSEVGVEEWQAPDTVDG